MSVRTILAAILLAGVSLAGMPRAFAQEPDVLMPEQSAAKAKQLLQQAIDAFGGSAYLNVHDVTSTGRLGHFDHAGNLDSFPEKFIDFAIPPNKDRTENLPKRNIIDVFNGDKGWSLDRGGVSDKAESEISKFQSDGKIDIDNILRHRIHEPDMVFRYGGTDIVDLMQVDWVELVDSDNRTIRLALAKSTHLPIRKAVAIRDPNTQMKTEEIEYYSNYHPLNGIETAFQITRERNGLKMYQVFFDTVEYNKNVSDSLFTKQSLDERWAQVGKKEKNKKEKDKGADKDKDKQ